VRQCPIHAKATPRQRCFALRVVSSIALQPPADPCSRRTLGLSNRERAGRALYEFRTCWIQELVKYSPYMALPGYSEQPEGRAVAGAGSTYLECARNAIKILCRQDPREQVLGDFFAFCCSILRDVPGMFEVCCGVCTRPGGRQNRLLARNLGHSRQITGVSTQSD